MTKQAKAKVSAGGTGTIASGHSPAGRLDLVPAARQPKLVRTAPTTKSRRRQGAERKKPGRQPIVVSLEVLQDYFKYPIIQAARRLCICTTVLKKICRRYGIKRWPKRPATSENPALEADFDSANVASGARSDLATSCRPLLTVIPPATIKAEAGVVTQPPMQPVPRIVELSQQTTSETPEPYGCVETDFFSTAAMKRCGSEVSFPYMSSGQAVTGECSPTSTTCALAAFSSPATPEPQMLLCHSFGNESIINPPPTDGALSSQSVDVLLSAKFPPLNSSLICSRLSHSLSPCNIQYALADDNSSVQTNHHQDSSGSPPMTWSHITEFNTDNLKEGDLSNCLSLSDHDVLGSASASDSLSPLWYEEIRSIDCKIPSVSPPPIEMSADPCPFLSVSMNLSPNLPQVHPCSL